MLWADVFAPPASGKSTICDPLFKTNDIERKCDAGVLPIEWRPFLKTIPPLLDVIKDHQRPVRTGNGHISSIQAMVGMLNRNLRKMAIVSRMPHGPYVGTAFAMRGIGIGWRLLDMGQDPNMVRPYFETMPTSVGFVYLKADPETLKRRNRARRDVPETSWEDRSFQIDLQLPVIKILKEVLDERGVRFLEVDTEHQSPDESRAQLVAFAMREPYNAAAGRSGGEGPIHQAPAWWR